MLMWLPKGNNCVFGPSQQTNKVNCIYLAFENLEISSKTDQQYWQTLKQSTNDVCRGENTTR